jgi:hypothetical protein
VEGKTTKERHVSLGVASEKVLITGHRSHDDLYELFQRREELRNDLVARYNLDPDQRLLILSPPQLAEHGLFDWAVHWKEIRFLCQAIHESHPNGLISLHPKMQREQYMFIEDEYSLPLAREPLSHILPAVDLFVATFSSTIPWAVLCGIPAIVVDFYNFDCTRYDFLKGVKVVKRKDELQPLIKRFVSDTMYYNLMVQEQLRQTKSLSPFDGKCTKRILDVILHSASNPF